MKRSKRAQLWVWSFALLSMAAQPPRLVRAEGSPPAAAQGEYRALIGKALQEYALGHWPEARVFFAEAHALWPNARTFRGLGMTCYEARNYVEAIDFLEHAIDCHVQPLTPKLADEARAIMEQARHFVSRVEFEITPAFAAVELDDRALEVRADGSVLLDPGEHTLEVSALGYHGYHRSLVTEAGQPLHVHVELEPDAAEAPAFRLATSDARDRGAPPTASAVPRAPRLIDQRPIAAGMLTGVGVAGIAAGWVLYAFHFDARLTLWREGLSAADGGGEFDTDLLQKHRNDGAAAVSVAAVGALLVSAAPYFWLPDEVETPAWAWVVGGAGAAIALGGIGVAVFARQCNFTDAYYYCQRVNADPLFAPMLALQALPFLSVPVMYLLRERAPESLVRVSVAPLAHGSLLSIGGRF